MSLPPVLALALSPLSLLSLSGNSRRFQKQGILPTDRASPSPAVPSRRRILLGSSSPSSFSDSLSRSMVMTSRSPDPVTPKRLMSLPPPPPPPPPPVPEKSQPLHNFSMPCLKWGNQKLLRCMRVNRNGEIIRSPLNGAQSDGNRQSAPELRTFRRTASASPPSKPTPSMSGKSLAAGKDPDLGIEEIRAKLLVHLRTAAKKIKFQVPEEAEEEESSARPWNLRTRRAACKAPDEIGEVRREIPPSPPENQPKSTRLRTAAADKNGEKKERRKFSVALAKDEIEEDFFIMTGSKPPRRPKKRARVIQKQLDMTFPGLWLSEVTPDIYKVPDSLECGKR
ncbi:hypothetical protein H6P81_010574 [Aristolochia fimbriata]|uniref:Uncharacterized protein n=1 Tax=Aristolochia fimbriata TaxID=158543 RepID=A0AAV7EQC1_ARIFI|nr:hypothetical protein H6P81_010574 [Aristolochia fimbriata]